MSYKYIYLTSFDAMNYCAMAHKFTLQWYKIQKYIQWLEGKKNQYKQGMSESGIK